MVLKISYTPWEDLRWVCLELEQKKELKNGSAENNHYLRRNKELELQEHYTIIPKY